MRVALSNLSGSLAGPLGDELAAAGHELVAAEAAEALVVGTGTLGAAPVAELGPGAWDEVVASVRAAFREARDVAARLLERGEPGRLIFVVEPSSLRAVEGGAAAAVAGAFLTTVAEVAAVELAPHRITANVVVAGWSPPRPEALAAGVPAGRLLRAADLAAACVYLLSPGADYVNGATLALDGGWAVTKAAGTSPLLDPNPNHTPSPEVQDAH